MHSAVIVEFNHFIPFYKVNPVVKMAETFKDKLFKNFLFDYLVIHQGEQNRRIKDNDLYFAVKAPNTVVLHSEYKYLVIHLLVRFIPDAVLGVFKGKLAFNTLFFKLIKDSCRCC